MIELLLALIFIVLLRIYAEVDKAHRTLWDIKMMYEHAILHLLYSRFFTLALKDEFKFKFSEPFQNLFTQGMVCHPTFKTEKRRLGLSKGCKI